MNKMLKSLAQSFSGSTGIPFEELLAEANLAYCEALIKFDTSKGAKESTYVYRVVQNALIDFCKKEKRQNFSEITQDIPMEEQQAWEEIETQFIGLAKKVVEVVLKKDDFEGTSRAMRNQVVCYLRNEGWNWENVWEGMKETKLIVNQIN